MSNLITTKALSKQTFLRVDVLRLSERNLTLLGSSANVMNFLLSNTSSALISVFSICLISLALLAFCFKHSASLKCVKHAFRLSFSFNSVRTDELTEVCLLFERQI